MLNNMEEYDIVSVIYNYFYAKEHNSNIIIEKKPAKYTLQSYMFEKIRLLYVYKHI